jgi:hypothetical protein
MEVTMKQARPTRIGLLWILAALAALLAVAGCTMMGDNLTGVQVNGAGPTTCVKQCNNLFASLYNEEQKLHDTNIEHCQTLAQPDKGACLAAEDARHQAAKTALSAAKIDCQNNCHRQGSGAAG